MIDRWTNKEYVIQYTTQDYSAIKKNEITPSLATWDYHTKWSKSDKDKYHMILLTCGN